VRFLSLLSLAILIPTAQADPFRLDDGDRVVFVGNTLIEREQVYGHWEAALTRSFAGKKVAFRNLGWSGDTVFGHSRAGFGTVADGFKQLIDHTLSLKPTVLFLAYGTNESFDGPEGLPKFVAGLNTLLDRLEKSKARVVLLSPPRQADLGRPYPDPTTNNKNLRLYADAIRDVAAKRKHRFLDLYDRLGDVARVKGATDNGIHLTGEGYRWSAGELLKALGLEPPTGDDEKLRRLIVEKNELYFHRWRPQNVTYLFGFRKHEQGKNAVEIPQFDPLVEAKEKQIHELARSMAK
jgi:lysophospholipase L1-like esterase